MARSKHLEACTNCFHKIPALEERQGSQSLPLDFILAPQAVAVACLPVGQGSRQPGRQRQSNPRPAAGQEAHKAVLARPREAGEGARREEGRAEAQDRRREGKGEARRGEGRKGPLCWHGPITSSKDQLCK
jgi:hypothetical protein